MCSPRGPTRAFGTLVVCALLGACAPLGGASPDTSAPIPAASPTTTPAPGSTAGPSANGLAHLDQHGISFDYPAAWGNFASVVRPDVGLGARTIAYLIDGPTSCSSPLETPMTGLQPACLSGAGGFVVTELINPGPLNPESGTPTTIGGRQGWLLTNTTRTWLIRGDAGNIYILADLNRAPTGSAHAAAVDAIVDSVRFSAAPEPPPPVVDGRAFLDTGIGVTFSFPIGWIVYYPQTPSMLDSSLVLVASKPLDPCTDTDCQAYLVPPDGIAVEFRIGGGPSRPDWSTATEMVGGQPAFRFDWGRPNAHGADGGHQWNVRFGSAELGIYASLSGPRLPELEAQLSDVVQSVSLDPTQLPH